MSRMPQALIVSTPPVNWVVYCRSAVGAGPLRTRPLLSNWAPWQGQTKVWPE